MEVCSPFRVKFNDKDRVKWFLPFEEPLQHKKVCGMKNPCFWEEGDAEQQKESVSMFMIQ